MPGIEEHDKTYLKALDHLNPTHEYGVAFERGTRISLDQQLFLISGTASIDRHGNVVYMGDVMRQADRLLENIDALLHDCGASLDDMQYFIVYHANKHRKFIYCFLDKAIRHQEFAKILDKMFFITYNI